MSLIQVKQLFFKYESDQHFSLNLNEFTCEGSEWVFIEGPSGSGKTTFLNLITGLMSPNQGEITILGTDITTLSAVQADRFRADHFGIIFQLFNLVPYLSVVENIVLPCTFSKVKREKALRESGSLEAEAKRLCKELDIEDELLEKPVQNLSIGQQQRVAIARAVIGQPEMIIADEPTSALDAQRRDKFMTNLFQECEKYGTTLLFVSHDVSLKSQFSKTVNLSEGTA